MTDSSPLTLHISAETKAKLDRLADHTHQSPEVLVDRALVDYLDQELLVLQAIERARADIRAGRGLTTDEVFRDVDAVIAKIEAAQAER